MVITDAPQEPVQDELAVLPGVPVPGEPPIVVVLLPDKSPMPESHAAASNAIQQPTSNARLRGCLRRILGNGKSTHNRSPRASSSPTDRTFYVAFPQTVVLQRRVPFENVSALSRRPDCHRAATRVAPPQTSLSGRSSQHSPEDEIVFRNSGPQKKEPRTRRGSRCCAE